MLFFLFPTNSFQLIGSSFNIAIPFPQSTTCTLNYLSLSAWIWDGRRERGRLSFLSLTSRGKRRGSPFIECTFVLSLSEVLPGKGLEHWGQKFKLGPKMLFCATSWLKLVALMLSNPKSIKIHLQKSQVQIICFFYLSLHPHRFRNTFLAISALPKALVISRKKVSLIFLFFYSLPKESHCVG